MIRKWLPAEPARCGLAVVAGLMLAFSFPHWSVAGLAWIAPGLMLASAMGCSGKEAFRLGFLAGLANWLVGIYWLLLIPVNFAPIVGWLLLCAFLSLYMGLWVWLAWKSYPLRPRSQLSLREAPAWFYGSSLSQRLFWSFSCAAFWVAMEIIQSRFLSGFPWNLLGTSQYKMVPLLQFTSYTGVYGVSFLVTWFSVSVIGAAIAVIQSPANRWFALREIILPALAVGIAMASGFSKLRHAVEPANTLKLALVQPSIPQVAIWDPAEAGSRFEQLITLTKEALAEKPQIVVWPEAALPTHFDTNVANFLAGIARQHQVWFIFGADDEVPKGASTNYYNSAFAISPQGRIIGTYRKRQLVMFGEYVPLSRYLPFLKNFTQVYGEFTPGKAPMPFRLDTLGITTSVLICFEDLFPHLAREYVTSDTDFLLNLTNNGWFGESAAQWQHAVGAVFRAIENGLPLVRCANNGLTCWVDQYGRMHEVEFPLSFPNKVYSPWLSKNIYRAGYKIANVPTVTGQPRQLTFYTRHGDLFAWACVAFTVAFPISRWIISLPKKGTTSGTASE